MVLVDSLALPADVAKAVDSIIAAQGITTPRYLAEPGSGPRDGFSSDVYRVIISDEAEPNRPALNIICKRSKNVLGDILRDMFVTEAVMYDVVLPALEEAAKLQEPLPWPRSYYSDVRGDPPHVMALGDLRPSNYRMADRTELMDAAHCQAVVSRLGVLHGAGLALKHLRPAQFAKLRQHVTTNMWAHPHMKRNNRLCYVAALDTPNVVKDKFPEGSSVNKSLVKLFNEFLDHSEAFMGLHEAPGHTIMHNDCHVNNLMFQYDKDDKVTGCRLIDFQTAYYGNPALDLCTLLLICTEKDVRDGHWNSLMRNYHDTLHRTLRAAGCEDPASIHSWDLFQSQMAAASVYALGMLPLYYNALYASEEDIQQFKEQMAAVARGAPANLAIKVTPRYKRVVEGAVQDMVDRGWLPSVDEIDKLLAEYAQQSPSDSH